MYESKIVRWHLSVKSRIRLENHCMLCDLERAFAAFVNHYNHPRYHESLDNLMPTNV